jgi:hypothetical protein
MCADVQTGAPSWAHHHILNCDRCPAEDARLLYLEGKESAQGSQTRADAAPGLLAHRRPLSILIFDLKTLQFLGVNDVAVQQYGFSREEFLGMSFKGILQKGRAAQFLSYTRSAAKLPMSTSGWRHHRKDGVSIDVQVLCFRLTFDGKEAMLALSNEVSEPSQFTSTFGRDMQDYQIWSGLSTDIISRVERRLAFLEINREIETLDQAPIRSFSGDNITARGARVNGVFPYSDEFLQPHVTGYDGSVEYDTENALHLPMRSSFPSWHAIARCIYTLCTGNITSLPARIAGKFRTNTRIPARRREQESGNQTEPMQTD